jgi:hypothetical protein
METVVHEPVHGHVHFEGAEGEGEENGTEGETDEVTLFEDATVSEAFPEQAGALTEGSPVGAGAFGTSFATTGTSLLLGNANEGECERRSALALRSTWVTIVV